MARDISRVTITGRLTKDVELRHTPSGTAVTNMRVAFSTSKKDGASGEWVEHSNYVDVVVWGRQAETCAQYLAKGRRIGVDGRLEFREWEAQDGGKRNAIEIVADSIVFLDSKGDGEGGGGGGGGQSSSETFAGANDDDIPF